MLRFQSQSFFNTLSVGRPASLMKVCGSGIVVALALGATSCTNLVVQRAMQKAAVAEVHTTKHSEHSPVIAFLGDSLTAGPGLSMKETFPAVIQQKIGGRQLPWIVQNSGVSGDTTRLALSRLSWVFKSKPKVLVVALGANDGLRGLSVDEMERNLRSIIARARSASIRVILVGQQLPHNFPDDFRARFTAVFPRLAREFRIPLVPFMLEGVALDERFVLEDGIHPNAAGARKIAENIWPVLSNVLKKTSKPNATMQ